MCRNKAARLQSRLESHGVRSIPAVNARTAPAIAPWRKSSLPSLLCFDAAAASSAFVSGVPSSLQTFVTKKNSLPCWTRRLTGGSSLSSARRAVDGAESCGAADTSSASRTTVAAAANSGGLEDSSAATDASDAKIEGSGDSVDPALAAVAVVVPAEVEIDAGAAGPLVATEVAAGAEAADVLGVAAAVADVHSLHVI
eukprot:Amastigsp_a682655_42.p2 type:complete len:198 gc:universal Amastigsp_a682655_42:1052-1645(+)